MSLTDEYIESLLRVTLKPSRAIQKLAYPITIRAKRPTHFCRVTGEGIKEFVKRQNWKNCLPDAMHVLADTVEEARIELSKHLTEEELAQVTIEPPWLIGEER